ncbi:MAG: hypothetical protein HWN67_07285 [Candidatus Helarchaeota archaeon]|nr:hypothetical protein [Candidatus Helarchaeota archaeon]
MKGETEPLGVTMGLDLGEVINRMDEEFICIGSGEILEGIKTFNLEEIRAYIVRKNDLNTVKNIFKKWTKQKSSLEMKKEVTLKAFLGTKDKKSLIVNFENGDTLISLILDDKEVRVRFIGKNLKFIKGFIPNQKQVLQGIPVYVHGLALLKDPQKWEIQGRALMTVEKMI